MPGWSFAELVPGLTQEVTSVLTELRDPHLRQQMFGEDFLCALGKYDDPVGLGNMLKGMPYFVRRHLGPSYTTKVDLYGPIHNQHPSSNICQTLTRVGNEVYPSPGGTTTQYCCMDQAHMQVLNVTGKSAKRERGKGYPIPLAKWLHGMMLSTLILGPCGFLAASFAFEVLAYAFQQRPERLGARSKGYSSPAYLQQRPACCCCPGALYSTGQDRIG
eukprot:1145413-Pelagomonas_calceolata.AAC.1